MCENINSFLSSVAIDNCTNIINTSQAILCDVDDNMNATELDVVPIWRITTVRLSEYDYRYDGVMLGINAGLGIITKLQMEKKILWKNKRKSFHCIIHLKTFCAKKQ